MNRKAIRELPYKIILEEQELPGMSARMLYQFLGSSCSSRTIL